MDTTTLWGLVAYLGTGAGIGLVVSLISERWPGFQQGAKMVKASVIAITCIVLSVGSLMVLRYVPRETMEAWDPVYKQLLVGLTVLIAWLSSQVTHQVDKRE